MVARDGSKRERHFASVAEFKTRFEKMSTGDLERRLRDFPLVKEAAIACRELLEERRSAALRSDTGGDANPTI